MPTVEELMWMTLEGFTESLRVATGPDMTRESAGEWLSRQHEAFTARFNIKGPIVVIALSRFYQVAVILPYQLEPGVSPPYWSPLADPRLLKAERIEHRWTWIVINGHPEWSNEQVIEAEMAERRRLGACCQDKY